MFQVIGEMTPAAGSRELRTFTVCVGRRETPADFYASDVKVSEEEGVRIEVGAVKRKE